MVGGSSEVNNHPNSQSVYRFCTMKVLKEGDIPRHASGKFHHHIHYDEYSYDHESSFMVMMIMIMVDHHDHNHDHHKTAFTR